MTPSVMVIGAGPYGMSLAAHLAARGIEHRIVGKTMRTWDCNMPNGMFLKSEGFASNIDSPDGESTLSAFCSREGYAYADAGSPVPIETFRAYGHWFQQRFVPHLEDEEVTSVSADGERFLLQFRSGMVAKADRVVVASGLTHFAHLPPALQSLRGDRVSHTSDHVDFSEFRGSHVAIVGAGQSALETAALIREADGHPEIIVRSLDLNWNPDPADAGYDQGRRWRLQPRPTPLGGGWELWRYWNFMPAFYHLPERVRVRFVRRALGPAGAWWLRPRFADAIPVRFDQQLTAARGINGGVLIDLSDSSRTQQLRFDHVIAGTGYRVDVGNLTFLAPEIREQVLQVPSDAGAPVLSRGFESSVPGLYLIGLPAADAYGPAMRFVCGTSFAGPRVARELAMRPKSNGLRLVPSGRFGTRDNRAT